MPTYLPNPPIIPHFVFQGNKTAQISKHPEILPTYY